MLVKNVEGLCFLIVSKKILQRVKLRYKSLKSNYQLAEVVDIKMILKIQCVLIVIRDL